MKHSRSLFLVAVVLFGAFAYSSHVSAAVQTSVTVEQISPGAPGKWTVIFSNGSSVTSTGTGVNAVKHSFSITDFGPFTISTVSPPGMSAKINVYRSGDLIHTETSGQYSMTTYPNQNLRFVISYAYDKLGSLGVTSTPSGIRFRMRGPTGRTYTSVSPHTFQSLPAGKYGLYFPATPGCIKPPAHSAEVQADTRNTINVSFTCQTASEAAVDSTRPSRRSLREQAQERDFKPRGQRK